jgi:hypothetical protein
MKDISFKSQIKRAKRWEAVKGAFVGLCIGISLGYAWHMESQRNLDRQFHGYVQTMETKHRVLRDAAMDLEGQRVALSIENKTLKNVLKMR